MVKRPKNEINNTWVEKDKKKEVIEYETQKEGSSKTEYWMIELSQKPMNDWVILKTQVKPGFKINELIPKIVGVSVFRKKYK